MAIQAITSMASVGSSSAMSVVQTTASAESPGAKDRWSTRRSSTWCSKAHRPVTDTEAGSCVTVPVRRLPGWSSTDGSVAGAYSHDGGPDAWPVVAFPHEHGGPQMLCCCSGLGTKHGHPMTIGYLGHSEGE